MFKEIPEGDEWNWLKHVHYSYHKVASSDAALWMMKATAANNDPPKSKHVRRLLIASLRSSECSLLHIGACMIAQKVWQEDPRVAAKMFYIIMLLAQYSDNVNHGVGLQSSMNRVLTYYQHHSPEPKRKIFFDAMNHLGAALNSKFNFHTKFPGVRGNFSLADGLKSSMLARELRDHLSIMIFETSGMLDDLKHTKFFAGIVLAQPLIDETIAAYRLLRSFDDSYESDVLFENVKQLIERIANVPYYEAAVKYPKSDEAITTPKEQFPHHV